MSACCRCGEPTSRPSTTVNASSSRSSPFEGAIVLRQLDLMHALESRGDRAGQQGRAAGSSAGGRRSRRLQPRPRRGTGPDRQQRRPAHRNRRRIDHGVRRIERLVPRPGRVWQQPRPTGAVARDHNSPGIDAGGSSRARTQAARGARPGAGANSTLIWTFCSVTAGARCSRSPCCAARRWWACW